MKARTSSRKAFSSGVKSRFIGSVLQSQLTPYRLERPYTRGHAGRKDDADVKVSGDHFRLAEATSRHAFSDGPDGGAFVAGAALRRASARPFSNAVGVP